MSRSGYTEDDDLFYNQAALYRSTVRNALRGRRGQAFLRELAAALDAMPKKELLARTVVRSGECCALGALAMRRGVDLSPIDYEDDDAAEDGDWTTEWLRDRLGILDCVAREVVYQNDEAYWHHEEPSDRWARMRAWVESKIQRAPEETQSTPQTLSQQQPAP
ncbi:MAG: hypothetical protein AB7E70_21575 [Hyphomicrobiaceae bacterium]